MAAKEISVKKYVVRLSGEEREQLEALIRKGKSAAAAEGADIVGGATGAQLRQRRLSEIQRHVLRVSCRRCERTVEIQTADAVRLYGGNAVWKDVAQRLLDNTCQQRTGRHEEDGCWPAFETP